VLVAPYFGCLCVCLSRRFFVFFITMVNFGDCSRTVPAFFAPGKSVNEALSSLKMGVLLWNEKKGSLFVIFGTSVMILHN
jgi:hypothetical protein